VVRRGRLAEYVSRWDYAIDAFVVDSPELETMFPDGCFIPLPEELQSYPFQEGGYTRRLAVYQMKTHGRVDCQQIEEAGS
jgi:hypothetical protein